MKKNILAVNPGDFFYQPGAFRFLLAFVVVLHHLSRFAIGAWAVDVFFILSGYWVYRMYLEKYSRYNHSVFVFYVSRYLRLLPVYACCLILSLLTAWLVRQSLKDITTQPFWISKSLLIVGSGTQFQPLVPAWSLDIEMQFYLLLPLLAALPLFRHWAKGQGILVGAAILFPLNLFFGEQVRWSVAVHLSFFLLGMWIFKSGWTASRKMARAGIALLGGIVLTTLILPQTRGLLLGGSHPFDPVLIRYNGAFSAVCALLILPYVSCSLRTVSNSQDRHWGNIAYPLYLFHWMPHVVFSHYFGALPPGQRIIYLALEVVVDLAGAVLLYFVIDRPCDSLRAKLIHKIGKAPQQVSSA